MIRGTTPTIKITILNLDLEQIESFFLVIKQNVINSAIVEKTIDDVIIDAENKCVLCQLTQEDTLKLQNGAADMQVRIKDKSGNVMATSVVTLQIDRLLKGGAI